MEYSNDPDDEVTIDPVPLPAIPIPRFVPAIADRVRRALLTGRGRARRELLRENGRGLTRRGWLAAVVVAVVVIGALKLAGVIWTSAPPAWVAALGPGVTVTGPEQVSPGHGSPGAVLTGALAALAAQNAAILCGYEYGSVAECEQLSSRAPASKGSIQVSAKLGYVAIDGTRALVGFTGKVCEKGAIPQCATNADPAAIFSRGKTFEELWTQTVFSSSGDNGYGLLPCVEAQGKWYLGAGPVQTDSQPPAAPNEPMRVTHGYRPGRQPAG